jgi:signal transduction histidine kinase
MTDANGLFQPSQRMHSRAALEGSGVDLATVHRIVTRYGGRVESSPGVGASFCFTLGEPLGR